MKAAPILFLLFFAVSSLSANADTVELGGNIKYLFSYSDIKKPDNHFYDHILQSRVNLHIYPSENLKAAVEGRVRGYYGDTVEAAPNFTESLSRGNDFIELDRVLYDGDSSSLLTEVDRLYADWTQGSFQLTAGRQRIAWGSCLVWNPIDIFNPASILDFDYEEGPSVDSLRLQFYTGPVSRIEAVYSPSDSPDRASAAGLASINFMDYDFTITAGSKKKRWFAGGGWAGDVYGAGFRGEILVTESRRIELPLFNTTYGSTKPSVSATVSGDYTYSSSLYVHTEVLYNSVGTSNNAAIYSVAAAELGHLSADKWSVYQEFSYDFHPLLRGSVYGIFKPLDRSLTLVPSLNYSFITNLDIMLLAMFFQGEELSEYGDGRALYYLRLKYSF